MSKIEEIVERERAKAWNDCADECADEQPFGLCSHHSTALALAVAKAVVAHFQPLVDAADDVASCYLADGPCGTCFGCHLVAGLKNARGLTQENE